MAESMRSRLRLGLLADAAPRVAGLADALALCRCAEEQGLAGWLAERARRAGDWPKGALERLGDLERVLLARGLRQLDRAGQVQERLLARGLRVLPLKGAALAERLYASPAERAMGDVDLLALDSFAESLRVLAELGFEPRSAADHAICLEDRASGLVFELHHALTSCPGLFPVDGEGLWQRRRVCSGSVGQVPGDEDLLVQLGLHATFQHGLVLSFGQYLDLRRLCERGLEVPRLLSLARASRALPALALALDAASRCVGAPVPAALEPELRQVLPARLLARGGRDGPLRYVHPSPPRLIAARLAAARGQRLRLLMLTLRPAAIPAWGGAPPERPVRRLLRLARFALRTGPFTTRRLPPDTPENETAL